jgi:GNAT superfamily N-acetyltransferase
MTDSVVRRAVLDDAEGFVRAHELAWDAAMGPLVGRSLEELAPFEERVARFRAGFAEPPPDAGIWVGERRCEIVGVAVRLGSELRDLYVVPEAWGTGVARSLLEAAISEMRSERGAEATLWVGEENVRARRFYEREGWQQTCETRTSQLGPNEVAYRLQLSP